MSDVSTAASEKSQPRIIQAQTPQSPLRSTQGAACASRPDSASSLSAGKQESIGYYRLEKSVGEGNFAKVKLATHTLTGEKAFKN